MSISEEFGTVCMYLKFSTPSLFLFLSLLSSHHNFFFAFIFPVKFIPLPYSLDAYSSVFPNHVTQYSLPSPLTLDIFFCFPSSYLSYLFPPTSIKQLELIVPLSFNLLTLNANSSNHKSANVNSSFLSKGLSHVTNQLPHFA